MKLVLCEDYEEMSLKAAEETVNLTKANPHCVLGLATGSTPMGMYKILTRMYREGRADFSRVKTFNLDEYYPISQDNPQSYHSFMDKNLFSQINIKKENIHILDGMCKNAEEECKNFEQLIEKTGGIDLQILGIGTNGHIGFNEPGEYLIPQTHLTYLSQSTLNANSRFFKEGEEMPKQALTMGIGTILKAKKILLLAGGMSKRDIIKQLLGGEITTHIPASMLKVHKDVVLMCDRAAYPD